MEGIEFETAPNPRATIIVLHGLGADGNDFVPICDELKLDAAGPARFVFPHAPIRPITIFGGDRVRAWNDILGTMTDKREDEPSVRDSHRLITALIDRERERGIAAERIVLMGFSQGCGMALMTGLRYPEKLAGIAGLSGYLPLTAQTEAERHAANARTPIFLAHGTQDPVVSYARGAAARTELERLGYAVEWHEYPIAHHVSAEEIAALNRWLLARLGA